jgi:hypothetical protein
MMGIEDKIEANFTNVNVEVENAHTLLWWLIVDRSSENDDITNLILSFYPEGEAQPLASKHLFIFVETREFVNGRAVTPEGYHQMIGLREGTPPGSAGSSRAGSGSDSSDSDTPPPPPKGGESNSPRIIARDVAFKERLLKKFPNQAVPCCSLHAR